MVVNSLDLLMIIAMMFDLLPDLTSVILVVQTD